MKLVKKNFYHYKGKVYDLQVKANDHSYNIEGIVVHNSAASSCVAWALGITGLNPLEHGLIFERFVNPDRKVMADIDFDSEQGARDKILEYLIDKYGRDSVCSVPTFGTYGPKSGLQAMSRGLKKDTGHDTILMKKITKLEGLEDTPDLIKFFSTLKTEDEDIKDWISSNKDTIEFSQKLLGQITSIGTHAGGIVITPKPIYNYIPVTKSSSNLVAAFKEADGSSKDLGELGILKLDVLGLKTLNIFKECINRIKRDLNIDLSEKLYHLSLDDKNLLDEFAKGDNYGIFQMEKSKMFTEKIKVDSFEDIVAINAINRPGPLEKYLDKYGYWKEIDQRKIEISEKELEKIDKERYPFPFMKNALKSTYGCLDEDELIYNPELGINIPIKNFKTNLKVQSLYSSIENNNVLIDNGIKEVFEWKLDIGTSIKLTSNHIVLTQEGQMSILEAFEKGLPLALPKKLEVLNEIESTDFLNKKARILGLLLGDGALSSKSNISFINSDELLLEEFRQLILECYPRCITKTEIKKNKSVREIRVVKNNSFYEGQRLNYIESDIAIEYRNFGLKWDKYGVTSHTKFIPEYFFKTSKKTKLYLLSGLWDSDGMHSQNTNNASYKTKSKRLATDIFLMCRQLGYLPSLYLDSENSYSINLPVNFYKEISPYLKLEYKKVIKEKYRLEKSKLLNEPINDLIKKHNISKRKILKTLNIKSWGSHKKFKEYCNDLEKIIYFLENSNLIDLYEKYYFISIIEKKSLGLKQVYDLNISNIPWFVASNSGVLVHNCLIFQEQFMQIISEMTGMSFGEADSFRRAIAWREDNPKYYTVKGYFDKLEESMVEKGYTKNDVDFFLQYCRDFMGYSFNKCLTENNFIETKTRGKIKILDVKIGEEILAHNPKTKEDFLTKVKNKSINGLKKVYRITSESGKQIECSLDHKILCENGIKYSLREILEKKLKIKVK